jgi:hypothetical protein
MRSLIIAGLALLFFAIHSSAQCLNWALSFSPGWANGNQNGNAGNLNGSGINSSVAITISNGSFGQSQGNTTPTIASSFIIPTSTSMLQASPNFGNKNDYVNLTTTFSSLVTNVSFSIADIDKEDAFSNKYYDEVTITGSDGVNTFYPTITRFDAVTDPNFLVITGNKASVNTANGQGGDALSTLADQRGTITVSFGNNSINSITIRFDNAPGSHNNPPQQSIGIGEIYFTQSTLPVSLYSFSGIFRNNSVILNWATAQEYNSNRFEIERQNSSGSWEKLGSINASGNSSSEKLYSFRDDHPVGTVLFYRLKMVDIDNRSRYSEIIKVMSMASLNISTYPNPFSDNINIAMVSPSDQQVSVQLLDVSGKLIKNIDQKIFNGSNTVSIHEVQSLLPGIYLIHIKDEKGNLLSTSIHVKK